MSRSICSLLFVLVSVSGLAQTPATAQPAAAPAAVGAAKVAWINLEQAIFNCEEGKVEFNKVQQYVEQKNAQLEGLRKDSDTLKNQLQVQGPKLTDEARADLENQIESKDTELQRFQQDTQKDIDNRRVKATNYIGRRMLPVIEKIAKEKGLSAILNINPSLDLWIDPSLIITDEVVKSYNAAYPVSAQKPPAPSAPAAAPAPAKKP